MSLKELKNKTEKELIQLRDEKKDRIRHLRFVIASGKLKNVRELRNLKREVARILTILNMRKSQENSGSKEKDKNKFKNKK